MRALRVLASPRIWLMIVGVAGILALIYFAYLAAVASPEENLKGLPLALVNEDEGGKLAGEKVNLGDQIVENITDPGSPAADTVEWAKLKDRDEALEGIGRGDPERPFGAGRTGAARGGGSRLRPNTGQDLRGRRPLRSRTVAQGAPAGTDRSLDQPLGGSGGRAAGAEHLDGDRSGRLPRDERAYLGAGRRAGGTAHAGGRRGNRESGADGDHGGPAGRLRSGIPAVMGTAVGTTVLKVGQRVLSDARS